MIHVHEQAFNNHHRDDHEITIRVMMQIPFSLSFLTVFTFQQGGQVRQPGAVQHVATPGAEGGLQEVR